MIEILKKCYENDIDLKFYKQWVGGDVAFRLEKNGSFNVYAQSICVTLKDLEEINNPDSYINNFLMNHIEDFIKNIERIEAIKPAGITIS